MSIKQKVSSHLPYLRRFARAMNGSQAGGDAYVVTMLEALVADPASLDATLDARVSLYKFFLKVWNGVPINHLTEPFTGAQGRLETLTPKSRQAFLLGAVEGFTREEVAAIMDISIAEHEALISQAGKEIAQQVLTDVLIIEDEPIIAMDLESLVEGLGHNVIHIARTYTEALEAVHQKKPGLILADVQLADGSSGVDAVNDILKEIEIPVIFITAYPERLLTGDKPEPAFLITKPFQESVLKGVISQALFFNENSSRKTAA